MTRPSQPIRLHRHPLSGHSHRALLMLSLLDLPFETVEVDIFAGAQARPDFLAMNPFAQVPVIQDGDATIADSNAILTWLALRYDDSRRWLPADPLKAAQVQRWLSVAAGELFNGPAMARINALFRRTHDPRCGAIGQALFERMEAHLATRRFLADEVPTIADVAMYSYTSHAPEGGVMLDALPNLQAWLARIEALPGFVGMQRHPAATVAA